MQKMCKTQLKMKSLINIFKWLPLYKPVHETTNYGKLTGTIIGTYLMYADGHTKVFMNNIEKTRSMYTKISGSYQG